MNKVKFAGIVLISTVLMISFPSSFGHGIGYEILDPVPLGNKMVSLEVTSSQYEDPDNPDREIQFSLFDTDTGITIRDVTYNILAYKGETFLFDEQFKAPDGVFVFVLLSDESDSIRLEKENQSSFFESLIGLKKEIIQVRGSPFNTGGLYTFKVQISTADSFSNEINPPIEYNVGLSIPQRTFYDIDDPNFGIQKASVVTYYDEIQNFKYDPATKSISFFMPFNWELDNIEQTSVIHEEITFPKTFGDLLVTEYVGTVNGYTVEERVITIDGFSQVQRIVHMVLNQVDLLKLYEEQNGSVEGMEFVLKVKEDSKLSTVTGNGQFRITLDWEPEKIESGQQVKLVFDITDVFLKDRPVAVDYDMSLIHNDKTIFSTSNTSTDSKEEHNEIVVTIPEDVSGPVIVQFDNMAGNSLARVGLPIVVDRISVGEEVTIPDWVRNNAKWWADGMISDKDFASGIQHMIKNQIIIVPITQDAAEDEKTIPDWVRNNAKWWADGMISDKDFASGIEFLVQKGIISV